MRKILFIIDKIELKYFEFNNLVTNFWLIKEFLDSNKEVFIATTSMLSLKSNIAYTNCYETFVENNNIYYKNVPFEFEINSFDLVMFRPDPPVDIDYINATHIFDFVSTKVVNSPSAIRSFNEKLHSLYFQEFMPKSTVTSSLKNIEQFLEINKEIVIKPLNRCFGSGVMYLKNGDKNTRTIINTLTNNESTLVMVQEYLPEIENGDLRILTLGERVLPYSIKKLPSSDDFKFNTHNDEYLVKNELSKDFYEYFIPVAKKLNSLGIMLAGLDVVGNKIIEINVTSPCYFIKEINNAYNIHLEKDLSEFLLTESLLSL